MTYLQIREVTRKIFSYFSTRTYVVRYSFEAPAEGICNEYQQYNYVLLEK